MQIRAPKEREKRNTLSYWLNQGHSLVQSKEYEKALLIYEEGLMHFPHSAELFYCKGVVEFQLKQYQRSIINYKQAINIKPKYVLALENLATAQFEIGLFNDALISINTALKISPNKGNSHARLACILSRLGHHQKAIEAATRAISLDPKCANHYMIRSSVLRCLQKIDDSIKDIRTAIELSPDEPNFYYNLSFDLLLKEEFEEGWACYEARFLTEAFLQNTPKMVAPEWRGNTSLAGKTILVIPEQGLGDQIQFGRYAIILKEMGAKVLLSVKPSLIEIMQSLDSEIHVMTCFVPASEVPHHDYYVSLMSLLGIFKTNLNRIPSDIKYLSPSEDALYKWEKKLPNKVRLKVGITWSGNPSHVNDVNRSMSLFNLLPIFDLNIDFYILQIEMRDEEIKIAQTSRLLDYRNEFTSFNETAGLINYLDLVISVDTSVAHLSAALGKPTWLMLPFVPDFRWLLNRDYTPWYPTMRLFRQTSPGDWKGVVNEIQKELHNLSN